MAGMKTERTSWEGHWRDISSYCQPRRSRFLTNDVNKGDKRNTKIFDDRAIWASGVLGSGMTSGCSSASRPWLRVGLEDQDMTEWGPIKDWLQLVEAALYSLFAGSNFYQASKSCYEENGLFGTEAAVMLEHPAYPAVYHPLTIGEYWLACDDALKPDSLYRNASMTVIAYCSRFPQQRWSNFAKTAYDSSNYDSWIPVMHAIEPNMHREPGKIDRKNKVWQSVYWEDSGGTKSNDWSGILEHSGFDEKPFWAARWDTTGSDVYGRSPGMNALPSVQALQLQALRRAQGIDYMVRPALKGPPSLQNAFANLNPGGMTFVAGADDGSFSPVWEIDPRAITALRDDVNDTREAVDRAFFADLFLAITNMRGVQPRNLEEIAKRNEEKLTLLGPVVERVFDEKLSVAVARAYPMLLRRGLIPPPPRELENQQLKLKFISVLAQAQQMIGLGAIERTLGFVGNLAASLPAIVDKVDLDQAVDEYASIAGTPSRIIRSDDKVAEIRQQRAQDEAAAKAAAAMPAAKDGADAARLLSEARTAGGTSLLDAVVGNA